MTQTSVVVAPAQVRGQRRVRQLLAGPRAPYPIAAIAFLMYSLYGVLRFATYNSGGYDLGIFDQAMQAYARLQAPDVPLKGLGYNLLGDHFHPVLVVLTPLYWIWSDPRMLLLAQSALIAASIIPVWRFTRRRLHQRQTLMVVVAYALCWPIQAMVDFDFHEVAFAVPLLAWLIDSLDRKAYGWVFACSFALLAVREDMGATVVMVALILLLRKKFLLAGLLAALGFGGYLFATALVIPAFAQNGTFAYWTYDALGPNLSGALVNVVRDPIAALRLFVTPMPKTVTLLNTFGMTTLFTVLCSPYLLLTIPLLAQRLFSSREALWGMSYHYSGPLAPILFMGGVDGLLRLRRWFGFSPVWVTRWAVVVLAIPLIGSMFSTTFPLGRLVTGGAWQQSDRSESLMRILPLIPRGVCVEADDRAVPHLTHRDYVTNPGIPDPPASYVLLDMSQKETGYLGSTPGAYLVRAQSEGFSLIAQDGTILLLHRRVPVDARCTTEN